MENNENLQVLDIQMKSGKDSYLSILIGHFSRMAYILCSPGELQSANIYYMSNLILSMIPGSHHRRELRQKLKDKIEEIKQEKIKEGYNESKAKDIAITAASVFIIGDATDFLNEFLGITKEARIEIDLAPDVVQFLKTIEEQKQYINKLEDEIKKLKETQ